MGMPVANICPTLQISRPTLYRWLALKPAAPVGKGKFGVKIESKPVERALLPA
jgi:hypothetical protein